MLWFLLAIIAYLINAAVFVVDKHLLASPIPKHHAYAFGVSVLSLSALVLIPFGVSWYGFSYFLLTVACGASFFIGLLFLYKVVKKSDISVAATQTGVMGAIFTYVFSVWILKDALPPSALVALFFLITGIFLLGRAENKIFSSAILAGLFFGLSYVLLKLSFNMSDFVNGLFWTRIGFVSSAFATLVSKRVRDEVKSSFGNAPNRSKALFVSNKIMAGIGFVILYFAIKLGNVSIVNALLGVQFMFTFLIAIIFRNKIPGIRENLDKKAVISKVAGMAFVLVGLLIFFI